jgi:hypothetical protein
LSGSGSQFAQIQELSNTVKELYKLLELYGPVWYTKELHEKAESAALILESLADHSNRSQSRTRAFTVSAPTLPTRRAARSNPLLKQV